MTVQEMMDFLKDKPKDAECYFSVWGVGGETKYRTRLSTNRNTLSPNKKFLRITWVDTCIADMILDDELVE